MSEPAVQCPRCGVLPRDFTNYLVTSRSEITLIAAALTALPDETAAP